jgi:hypothetical protein
MGTNDFDSSIAGEALKFIKELHTIWLDDYRVVGNYVRHDPNVRGLLISIKDRITRCLKADNPYQENYLIGGVPGSGKTAFIEELGNNLSDFVNFGKLKLSDLSEEAFRAELSRLDNSQGPLLCLIDEIDSRLSEPWSKLALITPLENEHRLYPTCFVLAGSSGSSVSELKGLIGSSIKGNDLVRRVTFKGEYYIPKMTLADRILVALCHFREEARKLGSEVRRVDGLALLYIALKRELESPSKIHDLAVFAIRQVGKDRDTVYYDDLFGPGEEERFRFQKMWDSAHSLFVSFINVKDLVALKPEGRDIHVSGVTETSRIVEVTPRTLSKTASVVRIADFLNCGPNESILRTSERLKARLGGIQGLLLFWIDFECRGLTSDAVTVEPHWSPRSVPETGTPFPPLGDLDGDLLDAIRPIISKNKLVKEIDERQNKPKVWIKKLDCYLTDRPFLRLLLGGLDYRKTRAIQCAFDSDIKWRGRKTTLRDLYETGELDILEHLPSMVVAHNVVITLDGFLLLAQRSGAVDFAPNRFSPSFEEQWNPKTERHPHLTVLRALEEEFNLDSAYGVPVDLGHISLVAVGREWGEYWNTALLYTIDLPCNGEDVIACWESMPKDKSEARAVGLVPVGNSKDRKTLLEQLKSGECHPERFQMWSGAKPRIAAWHPTTAAARIIMGLSHRYGVATIAKDVWDL